MFFENSAQNITFENSTQKISYKNSAKKITFENSAQIVSFENSVQKISFANSVQMKKCAKIMFSFLAIYIVAKFVFLEGIYRILSDRWNVQSKVQLKF